MKKSLIIASILAVSSVGAVVVSSTVQNIPLRLNADSNEYKLIFTVDSIQSGFYLNCDSDPERCTFDSITLLGQTTGGTEIYAGMSGCTGDDRSATSGEDGYIISYSVEDEYNTHGFIQLNFEFHNVLSSFYSLDHSSKFIGEFVIGESGVTQTEVSGERRGVSGNRETALSNGRYNLDYTYELNGYTTCKISRIEISFKC